MSQTLAHSLESSIRTKDVIFLDRNVTFDSLLLKENVLKGLTLSGFKKPSPIQVKAIPVGRCGFDLIVGAKSGTGKTLVYSIIALDTIEVSKNQTEVLILAPTREIAVQIQEVLQSIGSQIAGLKVESFIGGLPIEIDREKCKNCHIAVGAPGRVKHLIKEGTLKTHSMRLFILDEVDKLMESSFSNDINEIYNTLPDRKQIITTSATYPNESNIFLKRYMLSPTYVTAEDDTPLLLGLKQFVKIIERANVVQQMKIKNEEILRLLTNISFTQCIVFTNYQTRAESISNILNQKGWSSTYISAAKSQTERLKTVKNLKNFEYRILLSTDLTARGIDAANVDLIINYDIPVDAMTYLHRMGRAGRFGSLGICINLASDGEELQQLQNIIGTIGGPSMFIPKLPEFSGNILDFSKVEILSENYIYGHTSEANVASDLIKKELLKLKEARDDLTKTNKKTDCENIKEPSQQLFKLKETKNNIIGKNEENFCQNIKEHTQEECYLDNEKLQCKDKGVNIMDFLDKSKMEVEIIREQISNIDTSVLLNSLASGDFKMDTTVIPNNPPSCLALQELISPNVDESKKRKRSSIGKDSMSVNSDSYTCSEEQKQENILYKNKALLCVSNILDDTYHNKNPIYDLDSLQHYQILLTCEYRKELTEIMLENKTKNAIELLKNIDNIQHVSKTSISTKPMENINNIESIFKLGYDYATKANCKHWQSYLPASEIQQFQNLHLKEQINIEDQDEVEDIAHDDSDMEEEYCGNISNVKAYETDVVDEQSSDNFMKWVPVEKNEQNAQCSNYVPTVASDTSRWEHLHTHFNSCSDLLWQKGLTFQNVDQFDEWFYYEWQAQVYGIRNYIQQNIYVEEMKKYQEAIKK